MRLPNGYGSVYKMPGKRRKPFIARKTSGWTEEGKQLYTTIGYYKTKNEALQALAAFNENPYDIEMSKITFTDIYERWLSEKMEEDISSSTVRHYKMAYNYCFPLYKMKMADIRPHHMQQILNSCDKGYQTVRKIQILFNQLYTWCIEHDCVKKNYAQLLKINVSSETQRPRQPFTRDEINILWGKVDEYPYIKYVLLLIYSGTRISELLEVRKEDVNIDEQWFKIRASKTSSGIRTVPIADKVLEFWKEFINNSTSDTAICTSEGNTMSYTNFQKNYWKPTMDFLKMDHTPHETRHTCISLLTMANANATIIKKIVGHKSVMSLTEKVYTHIEISELIDTINLI